jgi:hypothetical protein
MSESLVEKSPGYRYVFNFDHNFGKMAKEICVCVCVCV